MINYKLLNNNNKIHFVNNQYYFDINNKKFKNNNENFKNIDTFNKNNNEKIIDNTIENFYNDSTNLYVSYDSNTDDIIFIKDTICDVLLVGGGGGGGCGPGGGGGAGGGISHIKNYIFNAGTYFLNIGQGGIGGINLLTLRNGGCGGHTMIYKYNSTGYKIILLSFGGTGGYRSKLYNIEPITPSTKSDILVSQSTKSDILVSQSTIIDNIITTTNLKMVAGQGGITYIFNNQDIVNLSETNPSNIFKYLNDNNKIYSKLGCTHYRSYLFNVYYGGRGGNLYGSDNVTIDFSKPNQLLNISFNNIQRGNDYDPAGLCFYGVCETESQTEKRGLNDYDFNKGFKGIIINITASNSNIAYGGGGGGGVTTIPNVINKVAENGEGLIGQGGLGGNGINNSIATNYAGTNFTNYDGLNGKNGIIIIKFNNKLDYDTFINLNT